MAKPRYRLDVTEFAGQRYVRLEDYDALHHAARQLLKALGPQSSAWTGTSANAIQPAWAAEQLRAALDPAAPK